jgi:hypothetical protein
VFSPRSSGWELKYILFPGSLDFVLDDYPVPCILGVNFLSLAKVRIDFSARRYCFLFQLEKDFEIESLDLDKCISKAFPGSRT